MAKIQVNQPEPTTPLLFTARDPLIVASDAGVCIIAQDEPNIVRLSLSWPEVANLIKKTLDRLPSIIERRVN
jgi:hypothetical protein